MQAIPSAVDCCEPCAETVTVNIPGPTGATGAAGTNGTNGVNAYTSTTAAFTMPAVGAGVTVSVLDSTWISPGVAPNGQVIHVQFAGYLFAVQKPNSTSVELNNLGYTGNAAPGAIIPSGSRVSPAGLKGTDGAAGAAGAPDTAGYITKTAEAGLSNEFALGSLATGILKNTNATGIPTIAIDGTDYLSPSTGVEIADIGVTVQGFDAMLAALAALVTVADRLPYFTGADAPALTTFTSFARTVLDDADAATARATLGVNRTLQDYILIRDEKASGTDGGTFTSGAWQVRTLQTEVVDTGGHSAVAANQITLQAGTYRYRISCPAYQVDNHQARLWNVTDAGVVAYGTTERAGVATEVVTHSVIEGRITIASAKVFEVQHQCVTTNAGDGFGRNSGLGNIEVYTTAVFEREAS